MWGVVPGHALLVPRLEAELALLPSTYLASENIFRTKPSPKPHVKCVFTFFKPFLLLLLAY